MNNQKHINPTLNFLAGFFAGLASFIALIFFSTEFKQNVSFILISSLAEELIKLAAIYLVFDLFQDKNKEYDTLRNSAAVGFGFFSFEAITILSQDNAISGVLLLPLVTIAVVHITTSIVLGFSLKELTARKPFMATLLFALALAGHLCYNLFVFML